MLDVQGDSAFNADNVAWSVVAGEPPVGIALQADGTLSGLPTVKNEAGASFEVKASYKGKDGQQVYSLIIDGVARSITQVAVAGRQACALTIEGAVYCWGLLNGGSTRYLPRAIDALSSGVTMLAAKDKNICVVQVGAVKCWGNNESGQLGNGTTNSDYIPYPVQVLGLTAGVTEVAVGSSYACAIKEGTVFCWGNFSYFRLGRDASPPGSLEAAPVTGQQGVAKNLTLGELHGCAEFDGVPMCWGYGAEGQLGDGRGVSSYAPVAVADSALSGLNAYGRRTCGVKQGAVYCWGQDRGHGEIGPGGSALVPRQVPGVGGALEVAGGLHHTCVRHASGALSCWGEGTHGELGWGQFLSSPSAVTVSGITQATPVATEYAYSCAISAGAVFCWGLNSSGQLGNSAGSVALPTEVVLPDTP